jgi:hypothetical protein
MEGMGTTVREERVVWCMVKEARGRMEEVRAVE